MSKLSIVRQSLEQNPALKILQVRERNYLPGRDGYWNHTVDYFTAPVQPLRTSQALQAFMLGLIPPNLPPTCKDDFRQYRDTMSFGKLYFDEDIGTERTVRSLALTDEELLNTFVINGENTENAFGFIDGKLTLEREEPLRRRTWVRVFPSVGFATALLAGGTTEYEGSLSVIDRYHSSAPRRLGRQIAGLLGR